MMMTSEPWLRVAPLAVRPQLHQHAVLRLGVGAVGAGHARQHECATGGWRGGRR